MAEHLLGKPVGFPHQLVGPVVLVGGGSRPAGDGGYVPVVVVGVFVGRVAAVPVGGKQGRLAILS